MLTTIIGGVALSLALVQQTDTLLAVRPDARLHVSGMGGQVVVRTWDRQQMRVVAEHSSRDRIEIKSVGSVVRVEAKSRHGAPRVVDFTITIPVSMDVEIDGTYMDADVQGVQGTVTVETVQGDVVVQGGARFVTVHSVQGDVEVRDARGQVRAETVNGQVHVANVVGEVSAETVNGDMALERIDAQSVEAVTVNGEITYDGTIRDGGRYWFNTHNGDVTVTVPERANVTVTVSTFSGDFESDFPVTITGTRDKRFSFTLGNGSARLELESFGGSIRLQRPSPRGR
jgi:DUF4097 and DUF4098 domain-containing protein YvlB